MHSHFVTPAKAGVQSMPSSSENTLISSSPAVFGGGSIMAYKYPLAPLGERVWVRGKVFIGCLVIVLFAALDDIFYAEGLPVHYHMDLVLMANTNPHEFIFVIGKVAYKSLDSFKEAIGRLPKGSFLEWDPGGKRIGGEPLLSSLQEMDEFKAFCKKSGVELVVKPGK